MEQYWTSEQKAISTILNIPGILELPNKTPSNSASKTKNSTMSPYLPIYGQPIAG